MNFFSGEEVSYEAKRQKRIEHNWNKISKAREHVCIDYI